MSRKLLRTALAAYMPRLDLRLLVVFALAALIPAWSYAAPVLTSADVSLKFDASPAINFGTLSSPFATPTESGNISGCTITSTGTCTYSFSLNSTGFVFEELCNADDSCDFPTVTLDLTSLVFNPAQILTGLTLTQSDDCLGILQIDCASRTFTSNSVQLSVVAFQADSGETETATGTFVTENVPTSVPEPATLPLLAAALAGLALLWHRRSRVS